MIYRMFSLGAMAFTLMIGRGPVLAADEAQESSHEGKVVNLTTEKLTMTGKGGKEHSHMLTSDAKLTLDGKECKPEALVAGTRIRVTTLGSEKSKVTRVEGIDTTKEFVSTCHDGKVVSIDGVNLVLTNAKGQDEHTCTLTPTAKITCDGEVCKASDLKAGMRIRITLHCDDENMAVCIEALDKNEEFTSAK